MRIVADTNIAFSAILNTNNKIAQILLHPKNNLNFYTTENLLIEITKHKKKIMLLSEYTDTELTSIISLITKKIKFINVQLISKKAYTVAETLTKDIDIDIDDTEFVALTEHLKAKLWSGDKKLMKGLNEKGWKKFLTTDELFAILLSQK